MHSLFRLCVRTYTRRTASTVPAHRPCFAELFSLEINGSTIYWGDVTDFLNLGTFFLCLNRNDGLSYAKKQSLLLLLLLLQATAQTLLRSNQVKHAYVNTRDILRANVVSQSCKLDLKIIQMSILQTVPVKYLHHIPPVHLCPHAMCFAILREWRRRREEK